MSYRYFVKGTLKICLMFIVCRGLLNITSDYIRTRHRHRKYITPALPLENYFNINSSNKINATFLEYSNTTEINDTILEYKEPAPEIVLTDELITDTLQTVVNTEFTYCKNTNRPLPSNITWKDNKWQYFQDGSKRFYYQAVYSDNRATQQDLKVFPIVGVPLGQEPVDSEVYALLWYKQLEHPVAVNIQQLHFNWRKHRFTNGTIFGAAMQTIALPVSKITRQQLHPAAVSFSKKQCPEFVQTYFDVIYPVPVQDSPEGIVLCPKCLYGNMNKSHVPYYVSWFEFLKYFGVTKVHMPYSNLNLEDEHIKAVFNYYIQEGYLTGFKYSPNNLFHEDIHETDGVEFSNMNDCFYRHLNQYKYIIHQDTDELFVPRKRQTYTEVINELVAKDPKSDGLSGFRCFAALHYTFHPPGNPEQPIHHPIFRYTLRQPTSHWYLNKKNPGGSKAIGFMANIIRVDSHAIGSMRGVKGNGHIPPEMMLVHHYRGSCRRQTPWECKEEIKEAFHDDLIVRNFAEIIKPPVEEILTKIGYFDSQ